MKALKPPAPSCHWPAISGIEGAVSAPHRPKSTTTLRRAISRFSTYSCRVVTGGYVSGCSITVVMPPAAADMVPVVKSSRSVWPGSSKCACMSIAPGITTRPDASISSSAAAVPP